MTNKEFALIIEETKSYVLSAIEKSLPERFYHAIDDIVQETYLRAYRGLTKNKFRGDSELSTWIYRIARNETLRMIDKLNREEKKMFLMIKDAEKKQIIDKDDIQEIEELYIAIEKLPEGYRDVMEMISKGTKPREIAKILNIKGSTVRSRATRARIMLKSLLEEQNHV